MPVSVIRLSLASYAWGRRLQYNGIFSDQLDATRGIGAGAAPATFELVCYVIDDVRHLQALYEHLEDVEVVVSLHVDDLAITANGCSKRMVVRVAVISTQRS